MTLTPKYSIILSCFHEERSIDIFLKRLFETIDKVDRSVEVVITNDGSSDRTWEKLCSWYESEPRIRAIIDLHRNSGQAAGITAGIGAARGENFVFIDSDLQLDPEDLPSLISRFEDGYDLVSGVRRNRQDSLKRRFFSLLGNRIIRETVSHKLTDFGCTFKIISGSLLRSFKYCPDKLFLLVEVVRAAGRISELDVSHHPRPYGRSGWGFLRLFDLLLESIMVSAKRPFQMIASLTLLFALIVAFRVLLAFFLPGSILSVVTSGLILNVIVILFLFEISLLCLIGEVALRALRILQRTPFFTIRSIKDRAISG